MRSPSNTWGTQSIFGLTTLFSATSSSYQVNWNSVKNLWVVFQFLPTARAVTHVQQRVLVGGKASLAVVEAIGKVGTIFCEGAYIVIDTTLSKDNYVIARSFINDMKAVKNATELEGFRQCHIRDGSALARYFAWLEEQLNNGVELNESQGADQLERFRS